MRLTTEEYLHGLISVVNELPRLSIHVVTLGDYDAPIRIASLVKRVEEVVYDIRLRGLGPTEAPSGLAAYVSDADAERVYHRLASQPILNLENQTHTTQTMGMSTN